MKQSEVVVITGASAEVGRATVCAFARQGARVGLLARAGLAPPPDKSDGLRVRRNPLNRYFTAS